MSPERPKTAETKLQIEYRKYAAFLLKISNEGELRRAVEALSQKGILFSPRPEISAIAGVAFSIEELNFLRNNFHDSIYFGIPPQNQLDFKHPIITFDPWSVDFSSPQIVAAYRALQHNFLQGKVYYLTIEQNPNVKNGNLREVEKEETLYNYLPHPSDYNNRSPMPNLAISSFEIGRDYILVSIDQNFFTHRVFNPEAIIEMSNFNYRLWETIFSSIPPELKVFLLNLTGDSIDILAPPLALGLLQSLLIKELNGQQIKVTAVPLRGQKSIICNTSPPAPTVFYVYPPLSQEIGLTAELQKYHKDQVNAGKWTPGVIALPQDLEQDYTTPTPISISSADNPPWWPK